MTAFAAVTLDDSSSASVVFTPSNIDSNGVAHLYSPEVSGFDSRNHLSLGVRLPKTGSSVARVTAKIVVPIMDDTDTTLKVGEVIGTIELVVPKRATETHRKDAAAFLLGFLEDASMVAAVEKLESFY